MDNRDHHQSERAGTGGSVEVSRCAGGGLSVSIQRKDCSTQRYASAANLSRILLRIGTEDDFLLMTSFKSTIPLHENQKRFAQIPKLVRSLLLSDEVEAYWLVGHWSADRNVSGCQSRSSEPHASACVDYLEYSWFLVKRKQQISLSDWLIAATLLASQYEQHAFIIRLGGLTTLRSGRGDIQKILQSDERIQATWASLARLRASDTPYGYAAILKTRDADPEPGFTASGETPSDSAMWRTVPAVSSYAVRGDGDYHAIDFFLAVTGNISSKMHFAALGVSDILPNDKDSRSPWDYPTPAQLYAAKWIRGKCG